MEPPFRPTPPAAVTSGAFTTGTPRGLWILLALAGMATLALAVLAAHQVPTVQRLDHYFSRLGNRRLLEMGVLLVAGAALPVSVRLAARGAARRAGLSLAVVALAAFAFQHALALAEKRGADAMRDQLLASGHNEFARTVTTRDIAAGPLVRDYEHFVAAPDQAFASTKPPGVLLAYGAAAALATVVMPHVWDPPPPADSPEVGNPYHWRLANFAALFFPLLSCAVLVPLFALGRRFLGPHYALWPPLLYAVVPATALYPIHLDQVLYPFAACLLWSAAAAAGAASGRRASALGAVSGAIAWTCTFLSFSLLPALPLAGAFALAGARVEGGPDVARRLGRVLGAAGAAFAALSLAAGGFAGYDAWTRFTVAMHHHSRWKEWQESYRAAAALTNLAEFAYWLGVPVAVLFMTEILARRDAALVRRRAAGVRALAWGTCLVVAGAALFGRTLSEVSRLWIFFVPAVVLVAAARLGRLSGTHAEAALATVVMLQAAWTFVLKCYERG